MPDTNQGVEIMKKNFILNLLLFAFCINAFAQDIVPYAMIKQNACATYAIYRGEQKKLNFGICYYKVAVNSVTIGNDGSKTVVYRTDMMNKKKQITNYSGAIGTEGGFFNQIIVASDGSYAMDQDLAYGYGGDMARGGFMFKIPALLNVGQTLENSTVNQEYEVMGRKMTSSLAYNDVKVEREEDYVTSVGTFRCYVVSYKVSGTAGGYNISNESGTIWLAPGYGIICYKYVSAGIPIYIELCELEGLK